MPCAAEQTINKIRDVGARKNEAISTLVVDGHLNVSAITMPSRSAEFSTVSPLRGGLGSSKLLLRVAASG